MSQSVLSSLKLSILVSCVSTFTVALLGTGIGFLLAKRSFRGKELIDSIITLPMVLPPTVTGYYLILILGRHGFIGSLIYDATGWAITFTWGAAVIASTVIALPIMVRTARAAIESVNPDYEIVSYTLGRGELETLFRVTLPLARNGIIAGVVLSFARALGEFGATLMIAGNIPGKTQTMPLAIYEAVVSGDDVLAQVLVILLTLISIIVVYFTNRIGKRGTWNFFFTQR